MMKTMLMKSSDNEIFTVELRLANTFGVIAEMFDILGRPTDEESPIEIRMDHINSSTMRLMLTWSQHHAYDPEPIELTRWDVIFLRNLTDKQRQEIYVAADFLNVPSVIQFFERPNRKRPHSGEDAIECKYRKQTDALDDERIQEELRLLLTGNTKLAEQTHFTAGRI